MTQQLFTEAPRLPDEPAPARRRSVRRTRKPYLRPALLPAAIVLLLAVLAALAPGLLTGRDPLAAVPAERLLAPDWSHPFGTDEIGRDLLTRVIYGAGASLGAMLLAVAIGFAIGAVIGLVSGFAAGRVDGVLMRIVDMVLAIPTLLLTLALVTALGFGTVHVAIAVGLGNAAGFARLMRAQVLRVRTADYVDAAAATGARWYSILGRHVLPNSYGPVLALATLNLSAAILAVSSLSFLGYGAPPPAPEWGSLIAQGRDYIATAWWLTALPGLTVAAVALSINAIARALDEATGASR
ncbi:MAG TPA: ABC transporter permease [Pseudonocardiaceae bacterium]|jgi:peptide/nickel transport system permease protein